MKWLRVGELQNKNAVNFTSPLKETGHLQRFYPNHIQF